MTFDPKTIAAGAKLEAVTLGRRYNSKHTYMQAELTLKAYDSHGAQVAEHGYGPGDAAELKDLRDALYAMGVTREETRSAKKVDGAAYLGAMRDGKRVRQRSRAVLGNTQELLENMGTAEALEKAQWIGGVLAQTSVVGKDAPKLSGQLGQMVPLLKDVMIGEAAKDRGGAKALADLEGMVVKLLEAAAAEATQAGTPTETEALDLLDGLVVRNCRRAREAARSASRELGEESIAKAFELSALPRRGGGGGGEGGSGGEGGGAGGGAAGGAGG